MSGLRQGGKTGRLVIDSAGRIIAICDEEDWATRIVAMSERIERLEAALRRIKHKVEYSTASERLREDFELPQILKQCDTALAPAPERAKEGK